MEGWNWEKIAGALAASLVAIGAAWKKLRGMSHNEELQQLRDIRELIERNHTQAVEYEDAQNQEINGLRTEVARLDERVIGLDTRLQNVEERMT